MENRSGTPFCPPKRPVHSVSLFYFLICIFLLAAGCGAPGEPQPPTPPVPQLRSGQPFVYRVRTLFSPKRPSLDSKEMTLRLFPVAERISSLDASLTEQGINLKWTTPTRTSAGEPLSAVQEYHVYRGE